MTANATYPRVLVLAMGRINKSDNSNNGLLVRNLFGGWPKESLAQIYSGGENEDAGFFGSYYQLGVKERYFGRLYFRHKTVAQAGEQAQSTSSERRPKAVGWRAHIRKIGRRYFMDTGLYELICAVKLSRKMCSYINVFAPQMIFVQGYSLSFTRLALLVAACKRIPIVYYPTDDWSEARYNPSTSPLPALSWLSHQFVLFYTRRLVAQSSVPIAFNSYMRDVYRNRFGKEFSVLMHGDESERFREIKPCRAVEDDQLLIVCTGDFDTYRWELLGDMDDACAILAGQGFKPCVMAYPVNYSEQLEAQGRCFKYVKLAPCPKHDDLVSILRGANILFLPERFGPDVCKIRLSISSKAHLFMFSGIPVIVYSDAGTGVARYAREYGWAHVVDRRDTTVLSCAVAELSKSQEQRQMLADAACRTIEANHDLSKIQKQFLSMMQSGSRCS